MSSRSAIAVAIASLSLIGGCSGPPGEPQRGGPADPHSGPDINLTSAPGVAFNYAYQFRLSDSRIASTQEAHASACESLGLARCRITGMSYSVDQNDEVTAELDLKLDPVIARQFGKSAQLAVENNKGQLIRLDIGSSDEGEAIARAAKIRDDVSSQLTQLRQELAKTKPGTDAHAKLLAQIQDLQGQVAGQSRDIEGHQAVLASTPMEFHYYGRGGAPGFRGNPLLRAWNTLAFTVVGLVGLVLDGLAVLLPVGLLLALIVVIWRTRPVRALRDWIKGSSEEIV